MVGRDNRTPKSIFGGKKIFLKSFLKVPLKSKKEKQVNQPHFL